MSENKKSSAEVATKQQFDLTNLNQENVPRMIAVVREKLAQIKGASGDKAGTDTELPGFGKRIKQFDKVEDLVMAYSAVENRANAYNAVAEKLGVSVKKYPFKLEGYTASTWLEDIESQLAKVKNKKDIERLEKVEQTLSKYLSEEDKMKKDLAAIGALLNDEVAEE